MIYFKLCQSFFYSSIDILGSIVRENLKSTSMSRIDFFNYQLSYCIYEGNGVLFPDIVVGYGLERSRLSFAIGYGGMSVSCKDWLIFCKYLFWHTVHSDTHLWSSLNRFGQYYFARMESNVFWTSMWPFWSWNWVTTNDLICLGMKNLKQGSSSTLR